MSSMVTLSIYLRQRSFAESTPVALRTKKPPPTVNRLSTDGRGQKAGMPWLEPTPVLVAMPEWPLRSYRNRKILRRTRRSKARQLFPGPHFIDRGLPRPRYPMDKKLARVEPGSGGITRRVAGRGFAYVSANGRRIGSERTRRRIEALAIPPGWVDVWISSRTNGHIQATGVDAAGRTQYVYHQRWWAVREGEKFVRSLAFAQRLPTIRRIVTRDLAQTGDGKRRTLAAAVRLMDTTGLRVGGALYAEENDSFGVSTLRKRHLAIQGDEIRLRFRGKSDVRWDVKVKDRLLADYFDSLPKTPRSGPAICHCDASAGQRHWKTVSDSDINAYLGHVAGHGFTAKDFRTWQGTVVAARSLSQSFRSGIDSPQAVTSSVQEAAQWLHNTPAVARGSYINPRVIDLFEQGVVADRRRQPDRAVLTLLLEG